MSSLSPLEQTALLRRFEPVLRFTHGERFYPMDVERYLQNCSYWVQRPNQPLERIHAQGALSLDSLAHSRLEPFGTIQFLKFIEPLTITELASYQLQQTLTRAGREQAFHAGAGRLARVGYGSRLLDALFSLSLFVRGRVPGDTAAAAAMRYKQLQSEAEQYQYYGRVVEQEGWLVLQYWYFYAFNNWRSGFSGVNDHEADWEMVCLYLYKDDSGSWQPEWSGYASHDFDGDDLRRRWDDPELEKIGEHPVVYVGAGSHASYYQAGEYLTELELPLLSPLSAFWGRVRATWERLLRTEDGSRPNATLFRIPFVDYARGDGQCIGPGQPQPWAEPVLLSPAPAWVRSYRGLWGLWARDPIAGENAPAGPMYDRNGTVRRTWYDPLGWAGLDKQVPPNRAQDRARRRQHMIQQRQDALKISIAEKTRELRDLEIEAEALLEQPHMQALHHERKERIRQLAQEIDGLRAQLSQDGALREALGLYAARLGGGYKVGARSHIHRAHHPASAIGLRLSRIAEVWAAASIGLVLLTFVGIVLFARQYLLIGVVAMLGIVAVIEAVFRSRLGWLLSRLTNALALIATLVLLYQFFWPLLIGLIIVAGTYILWENLRELN
ncbi:MAG: hypothetical protein KF821_05035 [Anaerolineales bacterium]|nr:hypothetical protein [Anaerolineales bacterium]